MIPAGSLPRPTSPIFRPPGPASADWRMISDLVGEVLQSCGAEVALEVAQAAATEAPEDGNLQFLLGQTLAAAGRRTEALAALAAALRLGTDSEVLEIVAGIAFTGPRYRETLAWLHRLLKPARYLEIGVFKGETLRLARPGTAATAVDPAPLPEADRVYEAPTTLHRLTSDAYFAGVAAGEFASPAPVGLSFIDGLHLFEQVLRDFINVEKYCDPGSVVVFHDTLPVTAAAASRPRSTSYWCGDVWKVVPCLRRFRPDLRILTIPAHPSGLTLVTGLDPRSTVLAERFEEAVATFMEATPPDWVLESGSCGDIANNPVLIHDWLAASPAGARLGPDACGPLAAVARVGEA